MRYPTCNFSLLAIEDVSASIFRHTKNLEPFSLVRLGDGEGLLLSINPESPESDFIYLADHIGPLGMDAEFVFELRDKLFNAIKCADIVGVRDDIVNVNFEHDKVFLDEVDFLTEFRKSFNLRDVDKVVSYQSSRRIAALQNCLAGVDFKEQIQFCSAWVHYELHSSGKIFDLLNQESKIGLISCRTGLQIQLEDLFDLDVKFIEIPDRYCDVREPRTSLDYISQLEAVLDQQLVEHPGMVYLVGGGFFGKLYCNLIKSQGGIAIDLGSLFDAWLGIPSRRLVYLSMFDMLEKDNAVPSQLLLNTENTRR